MKDSLHRLTLTTRVATLVPMTRTEFTTAQFVRSHGKQPRGTGHWAFQQTTADIAFDRHLHGEIEFFQGTLAEAKKQAARHFPEGSLLAVLS